MPFFLFIDSQAVISGDDIRYAEHGEEIEINCTLATTNDTIKLSWNFMDGSSTEGAETPIENAVLTNTLQFTVDATIHGGMITCIETKSNAEHSRDSITLIGMNHIIAVLAGRLHRATIINQHSVLFQSSIPGWLSDDYRIHCS